MISDELDPPSVSFTICNEVTVSREITTCEDVINEEVINAMEDVVITSVPSVPQIAPTENDPGGIPVGGTLFASGVHFLTHESLLLPKQEPLEEGMTQLCEETGLAQGRRELLEYLIQDDGSVVCKWCGELLPSRTHWYRHKYKLHVSVPPSASPLLKCRRCNVFFKSRKGYVGHLSSRHSSSESSSTGSPKADRAIDSSGKDESPGGDQSDYGTTGASSRGRQGSKIVSRSSEDLPTSVEDYESQRKREERLVAEIIDRVKRECEAQGSTVTRRGYTRRSTVMNT